MGFDVDTYNNLPLVNVADARFKEQLASANLTREQLFYDLAPLFLQSPHTGRYAVSLIHRHYLLKEGERMVTTGNSTKPSTDTSPNIVPDIWFSNGQELEHRFTEDPTSLHPPPPVDFLAKFKSILASYAIDVLGVCYAPDKLADGYIVVESQGLADRERVTRTIHHSAKKDQSYDVMWLVMRNPDGPSLVDRACGACDTPECYA